MVQRVYSVLSGGVLADKAALGLSFAGLETQLVNEQMEGSQIVESAYIDSPRREKQS